LGARLTGPQGSGILTSMSRANALLVVPEDRQRSEAGERLNALLLGEEAQLAERFVL
jgi:molybdopterin molybdotransferase